MASKGLPHPVSPTISVTRFSFIFWTILSRDARTGSGAIVDSLCDSFSSPLSYKNLSHTLSLSLSLALALALAQNLSQKFLSQLSKIRGNGEEPISFRCTEKFNSLFSSLLVLHSIVGHGWLADRSLRSLLSEKEPCPKLVAN
jgi:hypothetical protein